MQTITIGKTGAGREAQLRLDKANRHGLVAGATGTGKTVTLQALAEAFSNAGVPVFAADIKGDLSGIAAKGNPDGPAAKRAADLGLDFNPDRFPAVLWDIFGERGYPIKTSADEMGPRLMASMLGLNPTQSGAIDIAFKHARAGEEFILNLDELRWTLNDMMEDRETICQQYGNITSASIAAIQRNILALESQGGDQIFGEPHFNVEDFMRTENGRGVINLLHADQLMEAPKLYATFLLWLLTELFRKMPETGDLPKPKLVFFFDEAHLLFRDAPKPLMDQIERMVRLIRSKGIGVYFVTQKPSDVPDAVLSQLGNRIQHALRVFTPKEQRFVKAAASAFRPNPDVDVKAAITEMGVGEALVSCLDEAGIPTPVERIKVAPPSAQIGPISDLEREVIMDNGDLKEHYTKRLTDREQFKVFIDRRRAALGMEPIEWCAPEDEYQPGDYQKFVPQLVLEPPKKERPPLTLMDKIIMIVGAISTISLYVAVQMHG